MSDHRKKRNNSGLRYRRSNGPGEGLHRNTQTPLGRSKINQNNSKSSYQRQGSYDSVRKIVSEEGRDARNLIQYSVPVEDTAAGKKPLKSPPSPKRKSERSNSHSASRASNAVKLRAAAHEACTCPSRKTFNDDTTLGRSQLSSPGSPRKGDLRARYWAFLFDNLRRSVDEIYQTCETDESVVECKEVIMMLEQSTKDFKSLIERLELLKAYDNAEEGQKPTSLAWEVRKMSPGKSLASSAAKEFTPSPTASRMLNFGAPAPSQQRVNPINSWADRVKGITAQQKTVPPEGATVPQPSQENVNAGTKTVVMSVEDVDDTEGWETVQRGGKTRSRVNVGSHARLSRDSKTKKTPNAYKKEQEPPSSQKAQTPNAYKNEQEPTGCRRAQIPNAYKNEQEFPGGREAQTPNVYKNEQEPPGSQTKEVGIFEQQRPRTNSRDSEKENRPVIEKTVVIDTDEAKETSHPDDLKLKVEFVLNTDDSIKDDLNTMDIAKSDGAEKQNNSFTTEFLSDEEKKHYQEEEDLAAELEDALVTALSAEDQLTNQLEEEQDAAIESAIKEEQSYLKEIAREESLEIVVDAEENETESDLEKSSSTLASSQKTLDWDSLVEEYEEGAEYRENTSWAEMVDDAEQGRTPGRVVHMHERLSSPSRKRSPTQSRKRHEEKQAKAQELREKLLQEKAERLKTLTHKVQEVQAWKNELLSQRRDTMERKLQRAEEKRQLQLQERVRKAHEEETKANEIAFINTLEAQNKRHDILAKHQEFAARLQDLQEERQKRHEEKAAKEAAVEERRRVLEAERLARLQEMQEKRKQRENQVEQRRQEREEERLEAARTKEKEREDRMAHLQAQQQAHIEELQKKIQQKQDQTDRRHKERLEQIREKAFEMSVRKHSTQDHNEAPKLIPYETKKLCGVCNVMISSEVYLLSHLRGKKHQQAIKDNSDGRNLSKEEIEAFNLEHLADAPSDRPDPRISVDRERQRALKKRCKKLRQRMTLRGREYENNLSSKQITVESEHRAKLQKVTKDLNKYLQNQDKGPWPQNRVLALDRALGEIERIMEKKVVADQNAFRVIGGLITLSRVLLIIGQTTSDLPPVIPSRSLVHVCNVFKLACRGNYENCHYVLFSNKIGSLVDLLVHQLNVFIPDNFEVILSSSGGCKLPHDPVASNLMQLIAGILSCLAKHNPSVNSSEASAERMGTSGDAFHTRANDIVSYMISVGVADKLSQYFNNVRGPIDDDVRAAETLQHMMGLLVGMIKILSRRNAGIFEKKKGEDPTQLIATFQVTELVGIVSLMYGMLLHSDAPSRGENKPPELPPHTFSVATQGFKMLNHIATLDLPLLQGSLGEEGTSLEFRHIASYLLWYCSYWTNEELLHEVILCVGYFTVQNHDNQVTIQSGQPPTVLQQLCSLPFKYFSDPSLTQVLFPTLIACCYTSQSNREILEQELSCALLANFIEEKTLETQQKKLFSVSKKSKTSEKDSDSRMALAARFNQEEWSKAQQYFQTK